MSKSIKQRAAEELFDDILDSFVTDLTFNQIYKVKKLCVEMYDEGYEAATERAQDMLDKVVYKLDK